MTMASTDGPPLSLRPFPVADKKPQSLSEFVARINTQPGGFRAVTEEKLREAIRADEEEDGSSSSQDGQDVDMSDGESDEDDGDEEDLDHEAVRIEVLKNIDIAGNVAMLTLDSLSLLLSKQSPTQASVTLSQQLRDMVGIGSLGADRLEDSNITNSKAKDDEDVAIGWALMETNRTRDSAERASALLHREMKAESKYWEDVIAVQKAGWSICKMPQEPHTLGVRFGFSEASHEFRNHGLAALRRSERGKVQLDCGRLGGVSERLLVTYEKDGDISGRSSLPPPLADNASLPDRILEARNTVFAQELWHELSREARGLVAHSVQPMGSKLAYDLDNGAKLAFELVPLEDSHTRDEGLPQNDMAETLCLALHIFLSYAHSYSELIRTRPLPPHIQRSRGQQTTQLLLRPIIARLLAIRNIKSSTSYVGALVGAFKSAGLPSSFTLQTPELSSTPQAVRGPTLTSGPQILIRNILHPQDFIIQVEILPEASLSVRGRTFLYPVTATYYHVVLPAASRLQKICPPYKDGYSDIKGLADYLRTASARLITEHYLTKLNSDEERGVKWATIIGGMSIHVVHKDDCKVHFKIDEDASSLPILNVASASMIDGKSHAAKYVWKSNEGSTTKTLDEVLDEAVKQVPT